MAQDEVQIEGLSMKSQVYNHEQIFFRIFSNSV